MIQSTVATLRLAVSPGPTAPGAPVAVGGGGVFTLPGAGSVGDVAPGATMPDFAAMMASTPAGDRQPDAATGKGLPMPVASPAPEAGEGSVLVSLPPAVASSMPQPAATGTDDDLVTCGLITGTPLGLKLVAPNGGQPVPVPGPKVSFPIKAPPSGLSPVRPAAPPVAGSSVIAPVTPTPPQATPSPAGAVAGGQPTVSPSPFAQPHVQPIVGQGTAVPILPLADGEPTTPAIILTPPEKSPRSQPIVTAGIAVPVTPLAGSDPAMPPMILIPPVTSSGSTVAPETPHPVDVIPVGPDIPVAAPVVGMPVATATVTAPHKLPRARSDAAPVAPEPVADDRPVAAADATPPVLPAAMVPVPVTAQAAAMPQAVPLAASPEKQADIAAYPVAAKAAGGTSSLRPAAPLTPNAKPVTEPASPASVPDGPTTDRPVAPEQIFVARDTPAMQPPVTQSTLPRSVPIVEYAPVEAAAPVGTAASTPTVPAVTNSGPLTPDDIAAPVTTPTAALAAAVPIVGAIARPTTPATAATAVATPPRDDVAAMATALNATITAPAAHAGPAPSPIPAQREAPTPVAAAAPAANLTSSVLAMSPVEAATTAPASTATAPTTAGIAMPIAAVPTPPAAAPAPTGIVDAPVPTRDAGKPAAELRVDAPRLAPAPYLSPAPVGTTASAGIVFGAAKLAAQRSEREDRILTLGSEALAATTAPAERLAVAASQGGNQPSLDMTDQRWPHAMVAHIEALREAVADAANAADTRIRLVPDALGGIDIGVRQEGDTLHVHFAADQPQTRALLQEAQPRLAEAAEARGLKLGQTSVGTDAGQSQQRQQQPHQSAAQPVRRNSFTATTSADETGDGRIA